MWTCPFCGFEAFNVYWEKRHAKECAKNRKGKGGAKKRPAASDRRHRTSSASMLAATDKPPSFAPASNMQGSPKPIQVQRSRQRHQRCVRVLPPLPSPEGLPPPAEWEGFFEQQLEARCGMHALNNVVGEHIFTEERLAAAVHIFLAENPWPA